MSSCLSGGGGRTYRLDREIPSLLRSIPKTPSSSSNRSQSPSSSFSESSNSPLAISTKRSRTPRKRPNQIYTEAAALLSTIYPNIFTTKNLKNLSNKHAKLFKSYEESSELLPPFPAIADSGFLLHPPEKPTIQIEPKPANSSRSQAEDQCRSNLRPIFPVEFEDGFDTESLLNQETEQGIDSIMGNSLNSSGKDYDSNNDYEKNSWVYDSSNFGSRWLGFGVNSGFEFEFGGKFRALKHVGDGDWCQFPTVDICEIMPKLKVSEKEEEEKFQPVLCLKLNHDDVLSAWSNRGSPYEIPAMGSPESASVTIAKLMQLDLFSELGNRKQLMDENGVREASVMRYKEKRRTRLFPKKIRYQVMKVNSDRTPRMQANRKQRF